MGDRSFVDNCVEVLASTGTGATGLLIALAVVVVAAGVGAALMMRGGWQRRAMTGALVIAAGALLLPSVAATPAMAAQSSADCVATPSAPADAPGTGHTAPSDPSTPTPAEQQTPAPH